MYKFCTKNVRIERSIESVNDVSAAVIQATF